MRRKGFLRPWALCNQRGVDIPRRKYLFRASADKAALILMRWSKVGEVVQVYHVTGRAYTTYKRGTKGIIFIS